MRKRFAIGVLVVVSMLTGCVPGSSERPREGQQGQTAAGEKRVTAVIREAVADLRDLAVAELVTGGLVNFDPPGYPSALLAEAAPSLENGLWKLLPDGRMETTWRLRGNPRWHDGTPMTAEDLVFTVEVGRDRELPDFGHAGYTLVENVEARDERTLVVTWRGPYLEADWMFSVRFGPPLPRHVLESALRADKAGFVNLRHWTSDFVGNGPFAVREFIPGSHLQLAAFDGFVPGRPKLDAIEIRFIPDPNTVIANLLAGSIDVTLGPGLSIDQAVRLQESWRDGTAIHSPHFLTQAAAYPQFLTPDPPIVANVQFRRALAHAIDREVLVQAIQAGVGAPARAITAPTTAEFQAIEPSIVDYDYDVRRTIQLVEGLGFTRGPDGAFRDPTNQELSVQLWTVAGNDTYERTTLAVADYWRLAGITTVPRMVPDSQSRAVMPTAPGFQMAALFTDLDRRFHSSDAQLPENNFRGRNRGRYMNPELDALIDRYFTTVPRPERSAILADIVRHITDQVVVIHLFYNTVPQMVNRRLKNVSARTPRAEAWNVHLWDID